MARLGARLLLLTAVCATIGCDRVTKHVAATTLAGTPRQSFLADTVRLEYVENTGAFLGLGASWPRPVRIAIFNVANGLALLALVVMLARVQGQRLLVVGIAVFIAGGLSNLLDRVAYGSVIDFMNIGVGPVRTGIFNVADVAIMFGGGCVLAAAYRGDKDRDRSGDRVIG